MDVWTMICLMFTGCFGILAMIFALLKEKGAMLISGFNTMPKEDREKYDKARMSKDMTNSLFLWCGILLSGGILSYFFSHYFAMASIVVWLVLFFKDVHIDAEKAFGKYRK